MIGQVHLLVYYHIEGNFGGGKLWRIAAFGGINFGEFVVPVD